ncbi:MAG: hypothetical protein ACFFG0_42130, partial [Candidatus Thorarchaeota archaeon]
VIAPVENWYSKNPFESDELNKTQKFDLIIANPPYVPVPSDEKYFKWGDGGEYGIEIISNILTEIKNYLSESGKLIMVAYSLGRYYIENGSLLTGNIKFPQIEDKLNIPYQKIFEYLKSSHNIFYCCDPPAWIGYQKILGKSHPILYDKYNSVIFRNSIKKTYCEKLKDLKINYLHNLILESELTNLTPAIIIKKLHRKYLNKIIDIENKCWPEELRASKDNLSLRLNSFPEGCHGAFTIDGELVGFSTSQIINLKIEDIPNITQSKIPIVQKKTWMELDTNKNGDIRRTHIKNGNTLHFVSACTLPEYSGRKIWHALINKRIILAKQLNLDYIVVSSRLSDYSSKCDIYTYLDNFQDRYLKSFKKFGFSPVGILLINKNENKDKYWIFLIKDLKKEKN